MDRPSRDGEVSGWWILLLAVMAAVGCVYATEFDKLSKRLDRIEQAIGIESEVSK